MVATPEAWTCSLQKVVKAVGPICVRDWAGVRTSLSYHQVQKRRRRRLKVRVKVSVKVRVKKEVRVKVRVPRVWGSSKSPSNVGAMLAYCHVLGFKGWLRH